jgi:hypothetical protein
VSGQYQFEIISGELEHSSPAHEAGILFMEISHFPLQLVTQGLIIKQVKTGYLNINMHFITQWHAYQTTDKVNF